jgi:hypothetical protein
MKNTNYGAVLCVIFYILLTLSLLILESQYSHPLRISSYKRVKDQVSHPININNLKPNVNIQYGELINA